MFSPRVVDETMIDLLVRGGAKADKVVDLTAVCETGGEKKLWLLYGHICEQFDD